MEFTRSFRSVVLALMFVASIVVSIALTAHAAPSYCEGTITYGQTKSFTVAPGGTLDICFIPNGGVAQKLGAKIYLWEYWDDEQPPDVNIDIYVTASTGSATYWTYLSTIDTQPWWTYSPPLWLNRNVVFIFQISTSRLAGVNLRLQAY